MIDFIKIQYHDKCELEQYVRTSSTFAEVFASTELNKDVTGYPLRIPFENLVITIRNNTACVENSLHKLYNHIYFKEDQNYNDFTFSRLQEMIDLLSAKIPQSTTNPINRLEFGINITTDQPAKKIVNHIIMHKENFHSENNRYKGRGELKRFTRSQFDLKVYDKQFQYNTKIPTLRFEVVFKGLATLRRMGISNLESLRSKMVLRKLFLYLLRRFDEMVVVDNFHLMKDGQDKCLLYKYSNPLFWKTHIHQLSHQSKRLHRIKFKSTIQKYHLDTLQRQLREGLKRKFIYLMSN